MKRTARVCGWMFIALAGVAVLTAAGQDEGQARGPVVVLTIDGDVNPALIEYIRRGIRHGEKQGAELVLIRLYTPGGLVSVTRDIASDFLTAEVPIGVYVWPEGAHAGSAGTFITIGAHVAAMAPNTNIGAAHPVMVGGEGGGEGGEEDGEDGDGEQASNGQAGTLMTKITNDTVALIRNLADERGRNVEWAEEAVRESVVATAKEAVDLNVIDFVAENLDEFLAQADGMTVELKSGERTLHTVGAPVEHLDMNWVEHLLMLIAHPNVAYILMTVGVVAIIAEVKSPGFGGAGVVGAICLILGLFALSVLPVNWAGVALIIVGLAFLFGELLTPTHGVLTIGGIAALTIGSLMLFRGGELQVSRWLIAGMVTSITCFFVFILGAIVKSQKRKVVTGDKGMLGRTGEARSDIDPEGTVFADGTLWTATSETGPIRKGAKVEVLAVDGLRLTVRPADEPMPGDL